VKKGGENSRKESRPRGEEKIKKTEKAAREEDKTHVYEY